MDLGLGQIFVISGTIIYFLMFLSHRFINKGDGANETDLNSIWGILIYGILALGFILRLIAALAQDSLDFDEYAYMPFVGQDFGNYTAHYPGIVDFPSLVHYWLSFRALGESLSAYRSASLVAGMLFLLVATSGVVFFWPSRWFKNGFLFIVLSLLTFNEYALYLSRYSMFIYGNSLLVSSILFFLFMRLAESPLSKRWWILISLSMLPMAFFSRVYVLIPVAIGVLIIIFVRMWRQPEKRNFRSLLGWSVELTPFLIFPAIYAILRIFFPFTNLGYENRPDMAPLFFPTSGYPYTIVGIISFSLIGTARLFKQLLVPIFISSPWLLAFEGMLVFLAFAQVVRRRADKYILFTILFFLANLAIILIAGWLGLFPFGSSRYAVFLLLPTAILIGYGGSVVFEWLFQQKWLRRVGNLTFGIAAIMLLISSGAIAAKYYDTYINGKQAQDRMFASLREQNPALVFADSFAKTILQVRTPELFGHSVSMGWGTQWGQDKTHSEIVDVIQAADPSIQIDHVAVVLRYHPLELYFPNWSRILGSCFVQEKEEATGILWVGYFRRTNDSCQ